MKFYLSIVALALMLLSFLAGAAFYNFRVFPHSVLQQAFEAASALKRQILDYQSPYMTSLWQNARDDQTGVVVHDSARMAPGLTLFTSAHEPVVLLVSADGQIIHEWHIPSNRLEGEASQDVDPFAYVRDVHLYKNGDVLVFWEKVDSTPWGIAVARVSAEGDILWSHNRPIHHDIDVEANGTIIALDSEIITQPIVGLPQDLFPMLDDVIVVLDKDGHELKRVSIAQAMTNSPYVSLVKTLKPRRAGDQLHSNSVALVSNELARLYPQLSPGEVVVSIREGSIVAAIDLETEQTTWAVAGYWLHQHDVDLLANGHMLLFDNQGAFSSGGNSRVIEFDPTSMAIEWQYAGDIETPFFSEIRGSQERLENGNTLITESDQGRIFEVTIEGDIVWDYRTTFRQPNDPSRVAIVSSAQRIDPDLLEGEFGEQVRAQIQ